MLFSIDNSRPSVDS